MMVSPSMISSLGQDAPAPFQSYKDVVGEQQLTIDILCSMMVQEITRSCCDYLNHGKDCIDSQKLNDHENSSSQKLTAEDRAQIVDWCYGIVDVLQLARSNVAMAMSIANRFMSNPNRLLVRQFTPYLFSPQEIMYDRTMFQLLAVSVSTLQSRSTSKSYCLPNSVQKRLMVCIPSKILKEWSV
jgi:hypothetical protein